jgi:hypothetical protein
MDVLLNSQEVRVFNLNCSQKAVEVLRELIKKGQNPERAMTSNEFLSVSYDAHDNGREIDIVRSVYRRHRNQNQQFLLHVETIASMSVDGAVALVNDLVTVIARS